MSRKFGFDLLAEQVTDRLAAEVASQAAMYERVAQYGDTPIERLLFGAMFLSIKYLKQDYFTQMVITTEDKMAARRAMRSSNPGLFCGHNTIFAQTQVDVAGWRADFVFEAYGTIDHALEVGRKEPTWDRLIVECDGHDFHERTKEQAARDRERDRAAQLAGMEIFRFTGSELWRDPLGSANQIIQWANKRV